MTPPKRATPEEWAEFFAWLEEAQARELQRRLCETARRTDVRWYDSVEQLLEAAK